MSSGAPQARTQRLASFEIGDLRFGIAVEHLAEVCMVKEIMPMISPRPEIVGAIDLRGSLVPLLDPRQLCRLSPSTEPPRLAIVIENEERWMALGIDRTSAFLEVEQGEIQPFYGPDFHCDIPVRSGVLENSTAVNVLEPAMIFSQQGLPSSAASRIRIARDELDGTGVVYLCFSAGGAHMAIEAISVFATMPRQPIRETSVAYGDCMGEITYLQRRIPVVNAARVLGLGDALRETLPEIVVIRYPDDRLLGLAVDVIREIRLIGTSDQSALPELMERTGSPFDGVLHDADTDTQVFLLEKDAICGRGDLVQIASLSDQSAETVQHEDEAVEASGDGTVLRARKRCLLFRAGTLLASEITQVASIIEPPEVITPVSEGSGAVLGFFSHTGRSIALVSLHRLIGANTADGRSAARVLVVESEAGQVGLLVDEVSAIEVSDYLAPSDIETPFTDQVVSLKSGVVPYLDLKSIAGRAAIQPA